MVVVKEVSAKWILDSGKEKTIQVTIKTNVGKFSASAPKGQSTGKYAVKIYKKSLEGDIKAIKDFGSYFSKESIESFEEIGRAHV